MVRTGEVARGPGGRPFPLSTAAELMRPATSTVESEAHLAAAAYLMKHHHDSALVVITDDDDRRPIAVITDADISQAVADRRPLESTRISELHLPRPVTVETDTSAVDAAWLMLSRGFRRLPVVDHGRLVGMIEVSDVCIPLLGWQKPLSPGNRLGTAESPESMTRPSTEPER